MKKKLYKPILILSIFALVAHQGVFAFGDTLRPVATGERPGADAARRSVV